MHESSFYLHFPDKSRLLIAVADEAVQGLFDAMREMLARYRAHQVDLAHGLRLTGGRRRSTPYG